MRDGVCLRASQGAKEETPPSRSLQSSEGLTASDKSRRSLPLFPPCATCGGWRALIFHPERERTREKPRGVRREIKRRRKRKGMVWAPKNCKCPLNWVCLVYRTCPRHLLVYKEMARCAATAFFFSFVCLLCLRQVNCVFVERCRVAGSLCSVTFNTVSYLEQKSRTEVIILLNKFRCWMRLFAPAVLWS